MFSPQITTILKRQLLFLGTICEDTPRVRPMRPFVDDEGGIWLISYKGTEKNKEIEQINSLELVKEYMKNGDTKKDAIKKVAKLKGVNKDVVYKECLDI